MPRVRPRVLLDVLDVVESRELTGEPELAAGLKPTPLIRPFSLVSIQTFVRASERSRSLGR